MTDSSFKQLQKHFMILQTIIINEVFGITYSPSIKYTYCSYRLCDKIRQAYHLNSDLSLPLLPSSLLASFHSLPLSYFQFLIHLTCFLSVQVVFSSLRVRSFFPTTWVQVNVVINFIILLNETKKFCKCSILALWVTWIPGVHPCLLFFLPN